MSNQDSESNPIPKKRMGRPPKPKPENEKPKKVRDKNEPTLAEFMLSINKTQRESLTKIAASYGLKNVSALNRALARGELIILKLNTQQFNSLKSEALLQSFNSVEDYLSAIASNSLPIPTTL